MSATHFLTQPKLDCRPIVVPRLYTARWTWTNRNTKVDKKIDIRLWKYIYTVWLTSRCLHPIGNPYIHSTHENSEDISLLVYASHLTSAAFYVVAILQIHMSTKSEKIGPVLSEIFVTISQFLSIFPQLLEKFHNLPSSTQRLLDQSLPNFYTL